MPEDFVNHARNRAELAIVYLEDGAPRSALRILEELVEKVRELADERDAALKEMAGAQ